MNDKSESFVTADLNFMKAALDEARKAFDEGEVPVGAVVVQNGTVVGRGRNLRETNRDPTAHAEIVALRQAAATMRSWRLTECTLYVTIEPCPMCAGALVMARIRRLVYGASDPKAGAVDSLFDLTRDSRLNHNVTVTSGILHEEAATLMRDFFRNLRKK